MISTNFSQTIKCTIVVKQNKVLDFGKGGELMPHGMKAKYYSYFPPKSAKYIHINHVEVEWIPTVSHLLDSAMITIKLKDSRIQSDINCSKSLLNIKLPAYESWSVKSESEIYFPTRELKSGIPISFDVDLPSKGVKSDREMGRIVVRISFFSCSNAGVSHIGKPEITRQLGNNNTKGGTVSSSLIQGSNRGVEIVRDLIRSYLNGEMTVIELKKTLTDIEVSDEMIVSLG
ncbi:TPA_asm: P3 [Carrot gammacytorhabdovirus 1]|nr:TPA_asm: P3 [Carrot gammacytorhabdovirus 1]